METDKTAYEAFLQGDTYYLTEWEHIQETGRSRFNWYAFLFGLFWLLYRKMYVVLFLVVGLLFLEFMLEELLYSAFLPSDEIKALINPALNLLNALLIGSSANKLYLWEATRKIKKLEKSNIPEEDFYTHLYQKGGITFMPLIFIAATILVGMVFLLIQNN